MRMNEMRMVQVPVAEMISIPAQVFIQMYSDVRNLADMHQRLIRMYEEESALKKHHKAYLHVREQADEMCLKDKIRVKDILNHYEQEEEDAAESAPLAAAPAAPNPFRKRGKHEKPEKEEERDGSLDAFSLPEGMVVMTTDTLGVMQDDMIALTMAVEHLAELFQDIDEGGGYDRRTAGKLVSEAYGLSQDVFKRWDEADLAELN